jgi:tetratricopeptide (TPR) repeat protein
MAVPVTQSQPTAPVAGPAAWFTTPRKAAAAVLLAAVAGSAGWARWDRQLRQEHFRQAMAEGKRLFQAKEYSHAADEFRRAIDLNPSSGQAYSELAFAVHSMGDAETYQGPAIEAARKAVEVDPDCGPCHGTLGFFLFYHAWEWDRAEKHYREARRLAPEKISILSSYAYLLAATGRTSKALEQIDRVVKQHPFYAGYHTVRATILYVNERYEDAIAAADRAIALDRSQTAAWDYRSRAQFRLGRIEDGIRSLTAHIYQASAATIGKAVEGGGGEAGLRKLLEITGEWRDRRRFCWRRVAWQAALSDDHGIFAELEEAVRIRNVNLMLVAVDPAYKHLHSHARFQAILKTMGLSAPVQESSRR